jgi:hypothetical protein
VKIHQNGLHLLGAGHVLEPMLWIFDQKNDGDVSNSDSINCNRMHKNNRIVAFEENRYFSPKSVKICDCSIGQNITFRV